MPPNSSRRPTKSFADDEIYKSRSCLVPFLLLLVAACVGGFFLLRHLGVDLASFLPGRRADVKIIDPSLGLDDKPKAPVEPPPVVVKPEEPAEPPPPPKKTMAELKAEADVAQAALDAEIAKARAASRGKELPAFAGVRFGEVMKGAVSAMEAILSRTGTNDLGYSCLMVGPKLKTPFRKFDNPPLVRVTPKTHKAYRLEFTQSIVRQPGWTLNPETTNVVAMMARKLKCEPFSLDHEKYPLGTREFVFPLGEMTLTVGEYGGTRLKMILEHEGVRALAKSESDALRAEALGEAESTRALSSDKYPNAGLVKLGRVRVRTGTPKSFCGIVFGSLAPYSAKNFESASASSNKGFYIDYRQSKCEPFMDFDHGFVEVSALNGAVLAVSLYSDGSTDGLSDEEYYRRARSCVERRYKVKPCETKGNGTMPDVTYEVADLRIALGPDPRGGFYLKAVNTAFQKAW